jgi:23S rRNA (adenine2030-N6)-methyltransferase
MSAWDAAESGSPLRDCEAVSTLINCVLQHNELGDSGRVYPGSPLVALELVRHELKASGPSVFFELHSTDYPILNSALYHTGLPNVRAAKADGFSEVQQFVSEGRAGDSPGRFVSLLVDPSYEVKAEYNQVVALAECVTAGMPHSQTVIWYPRLRSRAEPDAMVAQLTSTCSDSGFGWLNATFDTASPDGERGLYGSGLFVINPPQEGSQVMRQTLPVLLESLSAGQDATWSVQEGCPEA